MRLRSFREVGSDLFSRLRTTRLFKLDLETNDRKKLVLTLRSIIV